MTSYSQYIFTFKWIRLCYIIFSYYSWNHIFKENIKAPSKDHLKWKDSVLIRSRDGCLTDQIISLKVKDLKASDTSATLMICRDSFQYKTCSNLFYLRLWVKWVSLFHVWTAEWYIINDSLMGKLTYCTGKLMTLASVDMIWGGRLYFPPNPFSLVAFWGTPYSIDIFWQLGPCATCE